jgi:hypothetical protein
MIKNEIIVVNSQTETIIGALAHTLYFNSRRKHGEPLWEGNPNYIVGQHMLDTAGHFHGMYTEEEYNPDIDIVLTVKGE